MKATAKWFSALMVGAFAFALALTAPGTGSAEASNTTVYNNSYKPSYTSQQSAKKSTTVNKGNTNVYYNQSNTTSYSGANKQTTNNYQNNTATNNNYNSNTTASTSDEQAMLNLINKERAANGLQPLSYDAALAKVARDKAQDMVNNNYFSHQSPTYGSPFDQMKSNGISYRYAGENLAGASDVNTAHTNLMNSDGHRKNILNSNYTKVGIGVISGGPYGKMYVQEFNG